MLVEQSHVGRIAPEAVAKLGARGVGAPMVRDQINQELKDNRPACRPIAQGEPGHPGCGHVTALRDPVCGQGRPGVGRQHVEKGPDIRPHLGLGLP